MIEERLVAYCHHLSNPLGVCQTESMNECITRKEWNLRRWMLLISPSVFKDSIFEGLAGASLGNILVKVNPSLVDEKVNWVSMREMMLACGKDEAKSK